MQNTVDENRVSPAQIQFKRPPAIRGFAIVLGFQGGLMLVSTLVNLILSYSLNASLVLTFSFLYLNISIFWLLLSWGLGTFKRWAYWVTLLVETLLLLQSILTFIIPKSPILLNGQVAIAPILIVYLLGSRNARAAFFHNPMESLSENERRGLNPHLFE